MRLFLQKKAWDYVKEFAFIQHNMSKASPAICLDESASRAQDAWTEAVPAVYLLSQAASELFHWLLSVDHLGEQLLASGVQLPLGPKPV